MSNIDNDGDDNQNDLDMGDIPDDSGVAEDQTAINCDIEDNTENRGSGVGPLPNLHISEDGDRDVLGKDINPYLTNPSTFILGVLGVIFYFLSPFSMKFLCANRIAPDGTPRSAASHLGLYCLPMSHKRDARLK